MKQHLEREIKLEPGAGFTLPELGGEHLRTRIFISTYHDTADLALAHHGVTFRHRVEDGAGVWQLKLPKGIARIELEQPGPPARPPLEMLSLLVAYLRGRPLVPVARLRTRREGVRAQGAEIVDDAVSVLDGPRVTRRFREVEIELLEGDERTLRKLERELRRAGAEAADTRPKLYRALDLAVPSESVAVEPGTDATVAFGMAIAEQLRKLLAHDPGTRLGTDPEELHQLRVATRRLRSYLRMGGPLVERAWADDLRAELGWLGAALGPARDIDVYDGYLRSELQEIGAAGAGAESLLAWLDEQRPPARSMVIEALSSERYLSLLERLEQAATPPLAGSKVSLEKIWRTQVKVLRRAVSELGDEPEDEALHETRILIKRARYAAELGSHELGKKGVRFVKAAKGAQDVLGDHQDSAVAEARVSEWGALDADLGLAATLIERQRVRRAQAREQWPAAWKALERRAADAGV